MTFTAASATTPADGTPIPASRHRRSSGRAHGVTTWTAVPTDTQPPRRSVTPTERRCAAERTDAIVPAATRREPPYEDDDDDDDDPMLVRSGRRRWPVVSVTLLVLLAVVGAGRHLRLADHPGRVFRRRTADGKVVVFRGVNQAVAGFKLSTMVQRTDIPITAMPSGEAGQIQATIPATSLQAAYRIVSQIRHDYKCAVAQADIRRWFADRARTTAKSKATTASPRASHRVGAALRAHDREADCRTSRRPGRQAVRPARPAAKPAASATPKPQPSAHSRAAGTTPKNTGKQQTKAPVLPPKPQLPPFCPAGGAAG